MGQKEVKSGSKEESVHIKVTLDKAIWDIISNSPELGSSNSSKISNICVSWLNEQGILSGVMKKRLGIK